MVAEWASLLESLSESEPFSTDQPNADARLAAEIRHLDAEAKREDLRQARQNRAERKHYASRIFRLVKWWLSFIGALVLLQGILGPLGCFALADSVLIAVSTTTTGSVTAILIVVARHLFPNEPKGAERGLKK